MFIQTRPPFIDIAFNDYFCGLSGSGEGLEMAGFDLHSGVNHWDYALRMFEKNHPKSKPVLTDISKARPSFFSRTRFKWASCECDTHSNARGVKEVKQQLELFATREEDPAVWRSRVTAWDAVYLALEHDPDCFVIENVVQFAKWEEYDDWITAWDKMGYTVAELSLNSQFFGVPQSRDRLYIVAYKRNSYPMVLTWTYPAWCPKCETVVEGIQYWKDPKKSKRKGVYGSKHGQYVICCPNHVKPVEVFPATVSAASIINFNHPAEPIYGRRRPLKPKTIARVRKGIRRFGRITQVVDLARSHGTNVRSRPLDGPLFTLTQAQTMALVEPLVIGNYSPGWARTAAQPLGTVTSTDHHALVVRLTHADETDGKAGGDKAYPAGSRALPTLTSRADLGLATAPTSSLVNMKGNSDAVDLNRPAPTLTQVGHLGVVQPQDESFLVKLYGTSSAADIQQPLPTVTASGEHIGVVSHAFLAPYNGEPNARSIFQPAPTITQVERLAMITHPTRMVDLTDDQVEEILEQSTFRMLEPDDELLPAMDLARYKLDGSRRDKTAATGNAVVAEMARQIGLAIRAAYYGPDAAREAAARYPERRSQWIQD